MISEIFTFLALTLSLVSARPVNGLAGNKTPILKREVPQEHSHQQFITTVTTSLQANNPNGIVDPVFGLLGNAAAAAGLGKLTDTECLQTSTADQAFTNAKAAADVTGMTAALIYRALERNTGKVGLQSNACTSVTPVNPEIAAVSQHQDPASAGAAATNKAIVLALAKQIASVGGKAADALQSGTFAPGSVTDNTGKGNTCDVATDPVGCIFSQNLLVDDATAAEVAAAAGGAATAAAPAAASPAAVAAKGTATSGSCVNAAVSATTSTPAVNAAANAAVSSSLNLGSCSNPTVKFAAGLDGRTEEAFAPNNPASFNHGSADKLGVLASFICGQLASSCKASATATAACAKGSTAASTLTGQAAADAFNGAFA